MHWLVLEAPLGGDSCIMRRDIMQRFVTGVLAAAMGEVDRLRMFKRRDPEGSSVGCKSGGMKADAHVLA